MAVPNYQNVMIYEAAFIKTLMEPATSHRQYLHFCHCLVRKARTRP